VNLARPRGKEAGLNSFEPAADDGKPTATIEYQQIWVRAHGTKTEKTEEI
jgi:hypothetical protein